MSTYIFFFFVDCILTAFLPRQSLVIGMLVLFCLDISFSGSGKTGRMLLCRRWREN